MVRIEGKRIFLRDFCSADIPWIHGWVNDPDVTRFLLEGYPRTLKAIQRFVEEQMSFTDPLHRAFAIARREDTSCIGITGCHHIDWLSRSAELGILIGEQDDIGQGFGTEAIGLTLVWVFQELNLHRLFLRVFDFNERAIRSYRRCGFVEEGRLREAYFRDGEYHDIIVMAILEEEYRARREEPSRE